MFTRIHYLSNMNIWNASANINGNQFIHSEGIATNICVSVCAIPAYTVDLIIGQIKCNIIRTVNLSQTERRIGEYFLKLKF